MTRHTGLLTVLACCLTFQPVLADTRDEVRAAMQRCDSLVDDRTWLECTYGAKQPMRAKLGLPPAPDYQQRLVPGTPPPATASSSIRTQKPVAVSRPPRTSFLGKDSGAIISTLARVQYNSQGAFIVTLDNGQVWQQANDEADRKPSLRVGGRVEITPGVLWTYDLKAEDNRSYKVQRRS